MESGQLEFSIYFIQTFFEKSTVADTVSAGVQLKYQEQRQVLAEILELPALISQRYICDTKFQKQLRKEEVC